MACVPIARSLKCVLMVATTAIFLTSCISTKPIRRRTLTQSQLLIPLKADSLVATYVSQAIHHLDNGRYKQAKVEFDSILAHRDYGEAYYHRAICQVRTKHYQAALGDLEQAYHLSANTPWIRAQCNELAPAIDYYLWRKSRIPKGILGSTIYGVGIILEAIILGKLEQNLYDHWHQQYPSGYFVDDGAISKNVRNSVTRPSTTRGGEFK
ncbi:MAG: tetratricopeptide repeat protein [Bacteroidaceae bacterium]|nr:tetratricopeptide repeat protein [Bacteroidaceae bacterium]